MEREEFMERFMQMAIKCAGNDEVIIFALNWEGRCCMHGVYSVTGNNVTRKGEFFSEEDGLPWHTFKLLDEGIHLLRFSRGECIDKCHIRYFNHERLLYGIEYLAMYQEYGVEPAKESEKKQLQESIRADKIKETLVWACYTGDKELMKKRLADPRLSYWELNRSFERAGTPLTICAERKDLESFRAIAERGADLTVRSSAGLTPIMTALHFSYDVMEYIYENYREQFDKQIKSFSCLDRYSDKRLYPLFKDAGVDMVCEGRRFPPLHSYVRSNNLYGLKFLLDNGVPVNTLNCYNKTALDVAKKHKCEEAAELLRSYGAGD